MTPKTGFFSDSDSFDQITLDIKVLDDNFIWLKGEEICSITFNNEPISIELPFFVELSR